MLVLSTHKLPTAVAAGFAGLLSYCQSPAPGARPWRNQRRPDFPASPHRRVWQFGFAGPCWPRRRLQGFGGLRFDEQFSGSYRRAGGGRALQWRLATGDRPGFVDGFRQIGENRLCAGFLRRRWFRSSIFCRRPHTSATPSYGQPNACWSRRRPDAGRRVFRITPSAVAHWHRGLRAGPACAHVGGAPQTPASEAEWSTGFCS
jgi:hypothetical protein